MIIVCGIDPDCHHTGVGVVASTDEEPDVPVFAAGTTVDVPKHLKGRAAAIFMARQVPVQVIALLRPVLRAGHVIHLVVEGQQVYHGRSNANPTDLLSLAMVSGSALTLAVTLKSDLISCPLPREWKGNTPKGIHQGRTCTALGIGYSAGRDAKAPVKVTSLPVDAEAEGSLSKNRWSHILDGVGLALWGWKKVHSR